MLIEVRKSLCVFDYMYYEIFHIASDCMEVLLVQWTAVEWYQNLSE